MTAGSGDTVATGGFDHGRAAVGVIAGPVAAALTFLSADTLEPAQRSLAAVLSLVVVFWVTEPIPVPATAVLGLALAVVTGVAPAAEVSGAFSSPTIFLFIGSFILARTMTVHGLDRRFAPAGAGGAGRCHLDVPPSGSWCRS